MAPSTARSGSFVSRSASTTRASSTPVAGLHRWPRGRPGLDPDRGRRLRLDVRDDYCQPLDGGPSIVPTLALAVPWVQEALRTLLGVLRRPAAGTRPRRTAAGTSRARMTSAHAARTAVPGTGRSNQMTTRRAARLARLWSQRELARRSGVPPLTTITTETGRPLAGPDHHPLPVGGPAGAAAKGRGVRLGYPGGDPMKKSKSQKYQGPPRAVGYTRVSTCSRVSRGTSPETQEAAIRDYCAKRGCSLIEVGRETFTGSELIARPELDRLRKSIRAGEVGVLVAYSVDRLTRQQNHIGVLLDELERHGARLEFVTKTSTTARPGRSCSRLAPSPARSRGSKLSSGRPWAGAGHFRGGNLHSGGKLSLWPALDGRREDLLRARPRRGRLGPAALHVDGRRALAPARRPSG